MTGAAMPPVSARMAIRVERQIARVMAVLTQKKVRERTGIAKVPILLLHRSGGLLPDAGGHAVVHRPTGPGAPETAPDLPDAGEATRPRDLVCIP